MVQTLLELLEGGDRRFIGRSEQVVATVLAHPELFAELFEGMSAANPLVRMRVADAVEKVTAQHPEWLVPYKQHLLYEIALIPQQEVRWHTAQLFPRLLLETEERSFVLDILESYLQDASRIVKAFSMQALAELAEQDPSLISRVMPRLEELVETGSPAMKSRGRKLLARLRRNSNRTGEDKDL
jgi:hypothetical protein